MAHLPKPGADNGTWGAILNDFLLQAHNNDGTLKAGTVGSKQFQDNLTIPQSMIADLTQDLTRKVSVASNQSGVAVSPDSALNTQGMQFKGTVSYIGPPATAGWNINDVIFDARGTGWRCVSTVASKDAWRPFAPGSSNSVSSTSSPSSYITMGGAVTLTDAARDVTLATVNNWPTSGSVLFATQTPEDVVPVRVLASYSGITGTTLNNVKISTGSVEIPDLTPAYYATSSKLGGSLRVSKEIMTGGGPDGKPEDLILLAAFDTSEGHSKGDYDIVLGAEAGSYGVLQVQLPVVMGRGIQKFAMDLIMLLFNLLVVQPQKGMPTTLHLCRSVTFALPVR